MFSMGNPEHKEPQDIVPLYFDKDEDDELPSDEEVSRIRRELQEENERIIKNNHL